VILMMKYEIAAWRLIIGLPFMVASSISIVLVYKLKKVTKMILVFLPAAVCLVMCVINLHNCKHYSHQNTSGMSCRGRAILSFYIQKSVNIDCNIKKSVICYWQIAGFFCCSDKSFDLPVCRSPLLVLHFRILKISKWRTSPMARLKKG
jgi:hypothetical protein